MADSTAPAGKPDLKATHARLRGEMNYFLEVLARAQAAGSPSVVLSLPALANIARDLTTSVLDLEAYLA